MKTSTIVPLTIAAVIVIPDAIVNMTESSLNVGAAPAQAQTTSNVPAVGSEVPESFFRDARREAEFECSKKIEDAHDIRWTGWGSRFSQWNKYHRSDDTIRLVGDAAEMQNEFGAWVRVNYSCYWNYVKKSVDSVSADRGRLSNMIPTSQWRKIMLDLALVWSSAVTVILWLGGSAAVGVIANKRDRDVGAWFIFSLIFSPLPGLILVMCLGPKPTRMLVDVGIYKKRRLSDVVPQRDVEWVRRELIQHGRCTYQANTIVPA